MLLDAAGCIAASAIVRRIVDGGKDTSASISATSGPGAEAVRGGIMAATRSMTRSIERPHRVVMLAYPHAQILDIAGPLEIFARASRWLCEHAGHRRDAYAIELVADRPGPVVTSSGLAIAAARGYRSVRRADTLLVSGGIGYESAAGDADLCAWIARMSRRVERLGSVCTGAFVLAAAGLLDGRTATTHWAYCDRLRQQVPSARVTPDSLYVCSDGIYTSAGVTAGMDMALAMVEQDWGRATALAVAQELVMFVKRPGGQSQFSRYLAAQGRDDVFGRLEVWMLEHLDRSLTVEMLARQAHMSARHFARRFAERMGTTPAAYVARLRLQEARARIEDGAGRLKDVARDCGYGDEQRLRRAFLRSLGVTPSQYRARFVR
jgi:transcriptional regulator GlxA family with amidase domain